MQLIERGRLNLADPVERYLPAFPRRRAGWPEIHVRHLLNHSSGLANPIPIRWVHPADQPARAPHQFTLELLARYRKLRFPAGAKASYTNLGYLALGEVIAAAADHTALPGDASARPAPKISNDLDDDHHQRCS